MKWQTAPTYLRRLIAGPGEVSPRIELIDTASVIGPVVDLLVYFAAMGAGATASRSQVVSFTAAAAAAYFMHAHTRPGVAGRAWDWTLLVHWIVVSVLALCLRSGVFVLLTSGWGWPAHVAILFAVLATIAVTRPGYACCISFSRWSLGDGAGRDVLAVGIVAFALLLRLVYSGQVELLPEEAYYWNYSRHLDFGYLDHPPMVGWLIGLGTAAFGDTEFGVRISALCCGAIAAFFTYRLTRNLFGAPSGLVAVVLVQTLPFFFLSGMLMTPDAPLTAAWVAALYFLERAVIAGRSEAWWRAGVCLGLGLLSKYTIGLLGVSTLIFMLLDARSRQWFRHWEPYGAALVAAAIFSPVIAWNAHNEWASFVFQTARRLADSPKFALHKFIAACLVLLTPTGLIAAAALLGGRAPDALARDESMDKKRAWRFLQISILVPLAVFGAFSLRHEVKLDWTGAPWVAAVPALAFGIVVSAGSVMQGARAWIRSSWAPTVFALLLIYGVLFYYLVLGIPGFGYNKHLELIPVGWRAFGSQINEIAESTAKASGSEPLIVGMDRYGIASELAFYAPDRAKSVGEISSAHLFGNIGLMYEKWFPLGPQVGRTLLLVAWDRDDLAAARVQSNVARLEPIKSGVLMRDSHVIRQYYYRVAHGYRGFPGRE